MEREREEIIKEREIDGDGEGGPGERDIKRA